MSIVICGEKSQLVDVRISENDILLGSMNGKYLEPEGRVPKEWERLKNMENVILVLTEGASTAALVLKVWPNIKKNISKIVYAGGGLQQFDAPGFAEKTVYRDPFALESLINTGLPISFAVLDTAETMGISTTQLAIDYARNPEGFRIAKCGVHIEFSKNALSFGRMICDLDSDRKFEDRNCEIILFAE